MLGVFTGIFWLMSFIVCIIIGPFLIVSGILNDDFRYFIFMGFIILAFGIFSIYYLMHRKVTISRDKYDMLLIQRKSQALCGKKEEYLKKLENSSDYLIIKEMFELLPKLRDAYVSSILNQPLKSYQPVSPYTAAFWGTKIGGIAVGLTAAQSAVEKQKAYEQNVKHVIAAEIKRGNAFEQVERCCLSIEAIIGKYVPTEEDWNIKKTQIVDEMKKTYRIVD